MAASGEDATAPLHEHEEPPDADWLKLTDGMTDYERFRYIARHILRSAIREARTYATDERIFDSLKDGQRLRAHLEKIDAKLREDPTLSVEEEAFLCAAVADAMEDLEMEASCTWRQLARLAVASRSEPAGREL